MNLALDKNGISNEDQVIYELKKMKIIILKIKRKKLLWKKKMTIMIINIKMKMKIIIKSLMI